MNNLKHVFDFMTIPIFLAIFCGLIILCLIALYYMSTNIQKQKQDNEISNTRKSQVGSGDRSEKIRTYNYPQGRITDHRIGFSVFQFENFLNGDMDEMVDNLIATDRAERLKGEE